VFTMSRPIGPRSSIPLLLQFIEPAIVICGPIGDKFLKRPKKVVKESDDKYVWVRLSSGFRTKAETFSVDWEKKDGTRGAFQFEGKFQQFCQPTETYAIRFKVIKVVAGKTHLKAAEVRSTHISSEGKFCPNLTFKTKTKLILDENLKVEDEMEVEEDEIESPEPLRKKATVVKKRDRDVEEQTHISSSDAPEIERRASPPRKQLKSISVEEIGVEARTPALVEPDAVAPAPVILAPVAIVPPPAAGAIVTPVAPTTPPIVDVAKQYRKGAYVKYAEYFKPAIEAKVRSSLQFDPVIRDLKYKITVIIEEM
jgi:hypothetical protein